MHRPWLLTVLTGGGRGQVRDASARLVGALPSEVCVMNSLTANLHLMMAAFYRPDKATVGRFSRSRPERTYPRGMLLLHHSLLCLGWYRRCTPLR